MGKLLSYLQVRPMAEDEMFKVMRSGKRQKKQWKRMVTKPTFVGAGFTRKPPKYERFIRPTGKKESVTREVSLLYLNQSEVSIAANENMSISLCTCSYEASI